MYSLSLYIKHDDDDERLRHGNEEVMSDLCILVLHDATPLAVDCADLSTPVADLATDGVVCSGEEAL